MGKHRRRRGQVSVSQVRTTKRDLSLALCIFIIGHRIKGGFMKPVKQIRVTLVCLMLCVGIATGGCLIEAYAAELQSLPVQQINTLLDSAVQQGIAGVVLGIGTPEGIWLTSAGKADLDSGEEMSPYDQIRLASITKTFTASLVWCLIEKGVLRQTDTISRWLPPDSFREKRSSP